MKIQVLAALIATTLALPAFSQSGFSPRSPSSHALPATSQIAPPLFSEPLPYRNDTVVAGLEEYRYFPNEDRPRGRKSFTYDDKASSQRAEQAPAAAPTRAVDGFEYIGGDGGWQPAQHKYEWVGGRFAHSDECDHAIRTVKAPTPAEIEATRARYPG